MRKLWTRFCNWFSFGVASETIEAVPQSRTWHPVKEHAVTDSTMYDMGWNPALLRYYVRASVAMLVKYSDGDYGVKPVALPGQAPERIKELSLIHI